MGGRRLHLNLRGVEGLTAVLHVRLFCFLFVRQQAENYSEQYSDTARYEYLPL